MKQFDLEKYNQLVAEGKTPKIVTRDGRSVRILCTDKKGEYHVVALVLGIECTENALIYKDDGKSIKGRKEPSDLFFADLEPTYRPYANAKEFLEAQKEHGMYIVKYNQHILPIFVDDMYVKISGVCGAVLHGYNAILDDYRWQDGSRCGVKEE